MNWEKDQKVHPRTLTGVVAIPDLRFASSLRARFTHRPKARVDVRVRWVKRKPHRQKQRLIVLVLGAVVLVTSGAACGSNGSSGGTAGADGGVFRSQDRGNTWSQKVFVRDLENGGKETIDSLAVRSLWFDPQDSKTLYLTSGQGLWLSVNGGESWRKIASSGIDALGIDHERRGTLYIAVGQRILKTTDAGQFWPTVYLENRSGVTIRALVVDPHEPHTIWAGNSAGELLRSLNNGLSWTVVSALGNSVSQIVPDQSNPRTMYVGTAAKGIFRSTDGGESWESLLPVYQRRETGELDKRNRPVSVPRKGVEQFVTLVADPIRSERLYYASKYGIILTEDGGDSWFDIPLLTTPGSVPIFDIKINPRNTLEWYYTSNSLLYRTEDGGITWRTVPVPTRRRLMTLVIDPRDTATLYLGTEPPPEPPKKKGLF